MAGNIACIAAARLTRKCQPVGVVGLLDRQENPAGQGRKMLGRGGRAGLGQLGDTRVGNLVGGVRIGQRIDARPAEVEQFHDRRDAADFLEHTRHDFLGLAIAADLHRIECHLGAPTHDSRSE